LSDETARLKWQRGQSKSVWTKAIMRGRIKKDCELGGVGWPKTNMVKARVHSNKKAKLVDKPTRVPDMDGEPRLAKGIQEKRKASRENEKGKESVW